MIDTSHLKKGLYIEFEGRLYQVLDYTFTKMAQRANLVRMRLKDVKEGFIVERTIPSGVRFEEARLDYRPVQFLYREDDLFYFMDKETFEQTPLSAQLLGAAVNYLKESLELSLTFYKGEALGIELPNSVELKVVDTPPAFKGDTSQGGGKPATLETGLVIHVPFFVGTGDIVKVDTRSGQYLERVG